MISRHFAFAAALLLTQATTAIAQTTGMAPLTPPAPPAPPPAFTPLAPGGDIPTTNLGGIAPGGIPIAPGSAAAGDTYIERIAPGGTRLAPGPAGSVGGSPLLSTPRVR
jgi:hypothetical protein